MSLPIEFIWGKAKPSHKPLLFKKALSKTVNDLVIKPHRAIGIQGAHTVGSALQPLPQTTN